MFLQKLLQRKPVLSRPHTVSAGDNLAADLQQLILEAEKATDNSDADFTDQLMQGLLIYLTSRDHKIFDHAYQLGLERGEQHGTKNI